MSMSSGSENKPAAFYASSGRTENLEPGQLRSKLAALLDDVTVTASTTPDGTPPPLGNSTAGTTPVNGNSNSMKVQPEGSPMPRPTFASQWYKPPPIPNTPPSPPAASAPQSMPANPTNQANAALNNAISIKGRTDGVSIEIGKGNWPELLSALAERLAQSSDFFRGGRVALDVGARPLMDSELQQIQELLEKVGMKLGAVRTKAERTFQAALTLGLPVKLEAEESEGSEAQPAAGNREGEDYFVYRGNLRSGQILEKREHVLIIGDVNPGAEVISAGDIFVWGRLRGIVHAGADGDTRAVIVALELDPVQLQIVDQAYTPPAEPTGLTARLMRKRTNIKRPEIAYIVQQRIVVEPWDETKPGGMAAFRR
ncbi:MAG: septum site-determining protein MinC [Caldilineaceae bacterium]